MSVSLFDTYGSILLFSEDSIDSRRERTEAAADGLGRGYEK